MYDYKPTHRELEWRIHCQIRTKQPSRVIHHRIESNQAKQTQQHYQIATECFAISMQMAHFYEIENSKLLECASFIVQIIGCT